MRFLEVILLVSLRHGCEGAQIRMNLQDLQVWSDPDPRSVIYDKQQLIRVSEDEDTYFFADDEVARLLDGSFTSANVEVRVVHTRMLTFSLIRPNKIWTLECIFATIRDLQLFFSQLRRGIVFEGSNSHSVIMKSLVVSGNGDAQPLTNRGCIYRKPIRDPRVGAAYSFNLVRAISRVNEATGATIYLQEADMVFLSRTFNTTGLIGNNKVGICVPFFSPQSLLLVRFADASNASRFMDMVTDKKDPGIDCSISNVQVAQRILTLDANQWFNLQHLPYLR